MGACHQPDMVHWQHEPMPRKKMGPLGSFIQLWAGAGGIGDEEGSEASLRQRAAVPGSVVDDKRPVYDGVSAAALERCREVLRESCIG